jgi:glycosyltransferase involved in cell wall biosynthesis
LTLKHRNDVRFVCVGEGKSPFKEELQRMAGHLRLGDRVLFAGMRKDIRAIYNSFDIATLTSLGEGFPNVVGEAMACGIPCVVTDAGDSERIVGSTGIVVPPGDPQALAQGWQKILEMGPEEKADLGKKARDRIVSSFGTDVFVDRTEETLRSLC